MKIGSLENKPVAPAATDRKVGADKSGTSIKTNAEASAQVELSSAASGMVSSDPTFDTAKVERISQAIRDGKFKINPEAIADKLIMNAEELLGRKLS